MQIWEFTQENLGFWYDNVLGIGRLESPRSDLNQTVEFIKEIEKLKSVTRFNRT